MSMPSKTQQQPTVTPTAGMEQLQSLLTMILRSLVENPDLVRVELEDLDGAILLRVQAADEDIGRIIGSQGRTVRSIRTCLLAAATKKGLRCTLEVLQNRTRSQAALPQYANAF